MEITIQVSEKRSKNYDSIGYTLGVTFGSETINRESIETKQKALQLVIDEWFKERGF